MVGKSLFSSKAIPGKEVCIILPALNEAETIGLVIDEIPKERLREIGYGVEVLVVDNNSTDRTGQIAREKGARVIVEPMRGKGRAITTAFKSISGDFIFILDADYTYPATYILEMLELLEGGYDVVLGSRLKGHMAKGAMTKFNLVGNYLLGLLANILCGTRISDLCTGCWALREQWSKT